MEDEKYKQLVLGSFGVMLFANDTFAYACADSQLLVDDDYEWALPIIFKYGHPGEIAVMAWIRKYPPIPPHRSKAYQAAYAEIELLNPKTHSEKTRVEYDD
jgi:hypothetical protein